MIRGIAIAGVLTAGCADPSSTSTTLAPITSAAPSSEQRVIALSEGPGPIVCSAVLLRPRVAITAAHCGSAARLRALTATIGGDVASGRRVQILEAAVHPSYDPATLRDDLALLLLAEDLGVTTELATIDDALVGAEVRLVGFGVTASDQPATAGVRREGRARIESIAERTLRVLPAPSLTCAADSGGAALIDVAGVPRLVGVTSRGDAKCASHTVLSRADVAWSAFIEQFVRASAPRSAVDGAACYGDEHCARGACVAAADAPEIRYCAPPCGGDGGCPNNMRCDAARVCRYPTPTPGALGAPCSAMACRQGECRSVGGVGPLCTRRCVPDEGCAGPFDCVHEQGAAYFCVPRADSPPEPEGGCTLSHRGPPGVTVALILALLLSRRWSAASRTWARVPPARG